MAVLLPFDLFNYRYLAECNLAQWPRVFFVKLSETVEQSIASTGVTYLCHHDVHLQLLSLCSINCSVVLNKLWKRLDITIKILTLNKLGTYKAYSRLYCTRGILKVRFLNIMVMV